MRSKNNIPAAIWLSGLAAIALGTIPVRAVSAKSLAIKQWTDSFQAGGQRIKAERFEPVARDKYPAIVLLHAVDGVEKHAAFYRSQARLYAQRGYVVFLIHYFDRTRTKKEKLATLKEQFRRYFDPAKMQTAAGRKFMAQHFEAWKDTVRQTVAHVRKQPNVDGKRIGLAGISLGACLALAVASQDDLPIAAVVELFGALPRDLRKGIKNLPPTLVIHGDLDKRIPPAEADYLRKLMDANGIPYESKTYEGMGHVFEGASLQDLCDAQVRVEAFFKKHLQGNNRKARGTGPGE
jgi:carboxymethylenebutenolidase